MHLLSKGAWKLEGRATLDPPALMPIAIWCHACMCMILTVHKNIYRYTSMVYPTPLKKTAQNNLCIVLELQAICLPYHKSGIIYVAIHRKIKNSYTYSYVAS